MDSSRLRTGEIVAGIGGFALFVFLFFDWFGGGAEVSGNVLGGTATISHPGVSGWDALTDLPGFLIILSGASGIALAFLAAVGQRVNLPVRRGAITATLGVLAVLLILWRMFAGSPTLKIGIFLGLGAAIAIAAGALMALAEDGFSPLVAVAGGRTKAMAASAPPATPAPAPAPPTEEAPAAAAAPRSSGASRSSGSTATRRSTTKKSSGSTTKRRSPAKKSGGSRSSSTKSSGTRKRSSGGRK
ncbi:MAG: hypothetical protein ACJ75Z_07340 [Solirubrobacterales bacterium]